MALYRLWCSLPGNQKNMENMVLALDPEARFVAEDHSPTVNTETGAPVEIEVNLEEQDARLLIEGVWRQAGTGTVSVQFSDHEITQESYGPVERRLRKKELIRRAVLQLFTKRTGQTAPWGILTGVRPTKVYHYLRDAGFSPDEATARLQSHYSLASDKAGILAEIGEIQRPYFSAPQGKIGLYIGIPFCPTRCEYCSFAAYPLDSHGHLLPGFLEALQYEVHELGRACRSLGLEADFIYIGGGTPTVLNQEELRDLLSSINNSFPASGEREFTVEAGRPETLDRKKIRLLKEMKVNRVSVNPQSMKEQTLKLIGRRHTIAQVLEAVSLVREVGIPCLNMDLIMGLPGENAQDWNYTLARIKELAPENLTLHTLAPKRAAAWNFQEVRIKTSEHLLAEWLRRSIQELKTSGYRPYYLYRQRRILANQENIGYCKPGTESIYNILMMEERRTILGLGGGAMTKWVDPQTLKVERIPNPKCPATYRGRIKELVEEKVSRLRVYVN